MDLDFIARFLLAALAVNYAILLIWFLAFVFARDFIRTLHGRWFRLSDASFDAVHYGGMAGYKLAIFAFNLAPLLALHIARGGG